MQLESIPHEKGVYILILRVESSISLSLSIGFVVLEPGLYAYVGSARGVGGLRSRIEHHLSKDKKRLWWHIDYLTSRPDVSVTCIIYVLTYMDLEKALADELCKANCWSPAVKGFGSSDKKSFSHLFKCICNTTTCINGALDIVKNLHRELEVGIIWLEHLINS
jgi:Uri superfamily endonuclease